MRENETEREETEQEPEGKYAEVSKDKDGMTVVSGTGEQHAATTERAMEVIEDKFKARAEGQVNLDGEKATYQIAHEVTVTVTHKFSSAIAKLSVSEKALADWDEKETGDSSVLGLVKTRIKVAPSVVGEQWEALCEEFAERVEEEMM